MTIEVGNNWPLIVATPPGEKALQKESAPHLPSQNLQKPVVLDNGIELESDAFWEKGAFIDIYI